MALSDDSISKIENLTEFGDGCLAKFQQLVNSEIDELNHNSNYLDFVSNTQIGKDLNSKLLKLRDVATDTSNDVAKLIRTTEDFVGTQIRLNSGSYDDVPVINSDSFKSKENFTSGSYTTVPGGTSVPSSAFWKR